MRKTLLVLFFVFSCAMPLLAQVDTAWVRYYNGPANDLDQPSAIAVDTAGNVYVTGFCNADVRMTGADYLTIKYYSNGDTAWTRSYNGYQDYIDQANAITADNFGNVYVTGWSAIGKGFDYVTIKYYPNGDTAWLRRYSGPAGGYDEAYAIAVDKSGNVYVTGGSLGSGAKRMWEYATIKYDSTGNQLWVARYKGPADSSSCGSVQGAHAIAVDDSGNVYVTGASMGEYRPPYHLTMSKGDTTFPVSISAIDLDYATVKYNSSGKQLWAGRYSGTGVYGDEASAIALDDSGNVYVTGKSSFSGELNEYVTIRYFPNGDTAWIRKNINGHANDIVVDDSGNAYVTGSSKGGYLTVKYYHDGSIAWARRYSGPSKGWTEAQSIALDRSGNIYVTGYSHKTEGRVYDFNFVTIKYDTDGNQLWLVRSDGSVGRFPPTPVKIAVDNLNNVYITGEGHRDKTHTDYMTVKYIQTEKGEDKLPQIER